MSVSGEDSFSIHISGIDEFLAERLLESGGCALAFRVAQTDGEGSITLTAAEALPYDSSSTEGNDFELSSCECGGLGQEDASVYLGRPVFTSSAYELFDFILGHYAAFDCLIEFTGNAWSVRVENAAE